MVRIVYLDYQARSVTGGHKYNDAFLDYLQRLSGEAIIKTPSCAAMYSSWRKFFSPLMELKRLREFRKGSLVFWGDTTYKHHFLLAMMAVLFKKIHSSIIIHHFSYLGEKGLKRYMMIVPQFIYISLFDDILVPSPYTLDVAKKKKKKKNIYYIPLPFRHDFNISEDYERGNLLYVGTVDKRKGIKYLFDALGHILKDDHSFDFRLNIVGKITEQDYYEGLIETSKKYGFENKVKFLGRVSDEQLEECYKKAELFVFPSLLEGYGIVLVEAMSKGLPIIAFNNSAIPYSIKDGVNGLLAINKDARSYAGKLVSVLGNNQYRHQLQEGMRKTINSLKTQEDFEKGIMDYFSYLPKK